LNRLRTLPINIVKIDKSFIDPLVDSVEDKALVRSVIDVTRALGMMSVAEGVEHPEQARALEELGCEAIQGYLYAKPARADDTVLALRRLGARQLSRVRAPEPDPSGGRHHLVKTTRAVPRRPRSE
jgi:EAL domain-containing protein (putative c-di-GMP-specific phosphodiesterase class I)